MKASRRRRLPGGEGTRRSVPHLYESVAGASGAIASNRARTIISASMIVPSAEALAQLGRSILKRNHLRACWI